MGKKARNSTEPWFTPAAEVVCPICQRSIPPDQRDEHHLVPKLKGGKDTVTLHLICHRQIHATFSEAELANAYNTVEFLLRDERIQKFVAWVRKKPDNFIERTKLSNRRR